MPTSETLYRFHQQFGHWLVLGIVVVYLLHVFAVAGFALPALPAKDRKRFVIAIAAAFATFVAATVITFEWILPWITTFDYDDALKMRLTVVFRLADYFSCAAWTCFGFGLLCEMPVLAFVLGVFGFTGRPSHSLSWRSGYVPILILSADSAPTPDPLTFLAISVPFIALYEICLGVLWLIDSRGKRDEKRFTY
jgi:sec-independent protein translocase protein TatC